MSTIKTSLDVTAVSVTVAAWLAWLPPIAAALSIVWLVYQLASRVYIDWVKPYLESKTMTQNPLEPAVLLSTTDTEQYADEAPSLVKFVKVKSEHQGGIWMITGEQLKGHERHYLVPKSGQHLPYNVVYRDGVELQPPRCLFASTSTAADYGFK